MDSERSLRIPVMKPSEVLGVFTTHLDPRFENADDGLKEKLLESMRSEDAILARFVEKARLDNWHRTVVEAAEKQCEAHVAAEMDGQTIEGAKMAETVEEPPKKTNGRTTRSSTNGKSM